MKTIKMISILFAIWLTAACTNTTVRQHQDYEQIAQNISSVVIIPPEVSIELIKFDGDNEELIDEQKAIAAEITAIAKQRFEEEGLSVIDFDIAAAAAEDEDFAYAVTQCSEAWGAAKSELYAQGMVSDSKKSSFATSLGPVANAIAEKSGAESIFLMHYQGSKKSSGVVAKDVGASILVGILTAGAVVPIQNTQQAFVDLALVESDSGKIVWSNRKFLAAVNGTIVATALNELPDVVWESELTPALNEQLSEPADVDNSETAAQPGDESASLDDAAAEQAATDADIPESES
ncbi:hypothetical protein SAMN02745866_01605 [Alteromonadaceae bacterium Bs31]|nr:hypothetical protein SAMN02745866_01605 [Alteromonadaceae bacterium Bs31]